MGNTVLWDYLSRKYFHNFIIFTRKIVVFAISFSKFSYFFNPNIISARIFTNIRFKKLTKPRKYFQNPPLNYFHVTNHSNRLPFIGTTKENENNHVRKNVFFTHNFHPKMICIHAINQ